MYFDACFVHLFSRATPGLLQVCRPTYFPQPRAALLHDCFVSGGLPPALAATTHMYARVPTCEWHMGFFDMKALEKPKSASCGCNTEAITAMQGN
jgi:hypothetical protein